MTLLVDVGTVRSSLNVINNAIIDAKIEEAIATATLKLEGYFNTSFARGVREDNYHLQSDPGLKFPQGRTRLLSSSMFADAGESVTVSLGSTREALASNPVTVETENYTLNYEAGVLDLFSGYLVGDYLKIQYTAGFDTVESVYQLVPDWLTKAANLLSQAVYLRLTSSSEEDGKANRDKANALELEVEMILQYKVRPHYAVHKPL